MIHMHPFFVISYRTYLIFSGEKVTEKSIKRHQLSVCLKWYRFFWSSKD